MSLKLTYKEIYDLKEKLTDPNKKPFQFLDNYTMECVRDLIYWWFEFKEKKLSKKRKEKIAKLVLINFDRKKYHKFVDYGFNRPEYVEWLKKEVEKRKQKRRKKDESEF